MEIEEFSKLEEKINKMINHTKSIKNENKKLKGEIEELKKDLSMNNNERLEIKKKVTTLIDLLDNLDK